MNDIKLIDLVIDPLFGRVSVCVLTSYKDSASNPCPSGSHPQRIDSLIQSNLADIVVELLQTLYEGAGTGDQERADLQRFIG